MAALDRARPFSFGHAGAPIYFFINQNARALRRRQTIAAKPSLESLL
jgi:hypothetical protein